MKINPLDKSGFTFAVSTLWGEVLDKFSSLAKVASSGKYIDLTGRPTKLSEFQNDVGYKTTDTTYGVVSKTANGLAPKLPSETATTKYLRQDGTWAVPPNTTYGNMSGASVSAAGKAGFVPAPAAGEQGKYLKGDGTWGTPPDTVYTHPTTAGNAHIPAGGAANQVLMWLKDGFAKWANLGAAAFASLANNLSTTEPGFAMDARMGPVIDTRFVDMETQIAELNSALGVKIAILKGKAPASDTGSIQTVRLPLPEGFNANAQVIGIRIGQYPYLPYVAGQTVNVSIDNNGVYLAFLGVKDYFINEDIFITVLQKS